MDPSTSGDRSDIAGMRAYVDELQARFEKMTREGPAIQQKAAEVRATEKSADGLISATVGPRGDLLKLELDPRIYRRPDSQELAETITETVKAAGVKASEQVLDLFAPIIPREDMQMHLDGNVDGVLDRISDKMLGKG